MRFEFFSRVRLGFCFFSKIKNALRATASPRFSANTLAANLHANVLLSPANLHAFFVNIAIPLLLSAKF